MQEFYRCEECRNYIANFDFGGVCPLCKRKEKLESKNSEKSRRDSKSSKR